MQAGWWRMLFAMIIGGVHAARARAAAATSTAIAGHRISEIDGFSPATVKPFDEFAMLGPGRSRRRAPPRSPRTSASPVAIVDANNINVEVLGTSPGFPVDRAVVREVLLDNPLGQNDELHADHRRPPDLIGPAGPSRDQERKRRSVGGIAWTGAARFGSMQWRGFGPRNEVDKGRVSAWPRSVPGA